MVSGRYPAVSPIASMGAQGVSEGAVKKRITLPFKPTVKKTQSIAANVAFALVVSDRVKITEDTRYIVFRFRKARKKR